MIEVVRAGKWAMKGVGSGKSARITVTCAAERLRKLFIDKMPEGSMVDLHVVIMDAGMHRFHDCYM